jgi:hypothetical protein
MGFTGQMFARVTGLLLAISWSAHATLIVFVAFKSGTLICADRMVTTEGVASYLSRLAAYLRRALHSLKASVSRRDCVISWVAAMILKSRFNSAVTRKFRATILPGSGFSARLFFLAPVFTDTFRSLLCLRCSTKACKQESTNMSYSFGTGGR